MNNIKAEIAYLALDDDVLINKTICEDELCVDTDTLYSNNIWIRLQNDENILTILITLDDPSIIESLYYMRVSGSEELSTDVILDIFEESLFSEDIKNVKEDTIGLIFDIIDDSLIIFYQERDFLMYAPSKGLVHPWFTLYS